MRAYYDEHTRTWYIESGFYFGLAVQNWRTAISNNKATS